MTDTIRIQPPLTEWKRPVVCRAFAKFAAEHGPLIAVKHSLGPRWSQIDDAMRVVVGAEHDRPHDQRGLWIWYHHDNNKPWWTAVASATVEHFASREEAMDAEADAIRRERPLWNVVHNN